MIKDVDRDNGGDQAPRCKRCQGHGQVTQAVGGVGRTKGHERDRVSVEEALPDAHLQGGASGGALKKHALKQFGSVEGRNPDGSWDVEKIIKKKGDGFIVRWMNWGPEHDSWCPAKDVQTDLIEDFELLNDPTKEQPDALRSQGAVHTLERCKGEDTNVQQMRIVDARADIAAFPRLHRRQRYP